MLPVSDLQSLNEYILLRRMSEFKSSYGIFNIMPLLIINKTIITSPALKSIMSLSWYLQISEESVVPENTSI